MRLLGFGTARERQEADLFYAALMGRRPARGRLLEAAEDDPAPTMDVTVRVHGRFGGDLSSRVTVKEGGKTLASGTLGPSDAEVTLTVARAARYTIAVVPTAAAPDDRYRATTQKVKAASAVTLKLNVNRWNEKNVYDTWRDNDIDVAKARQVSRKPLCGRRVNVNREAEARVEAANRAFLALPEATRDAITAALPIVGGYAFRTQTTGAFSNHSLGTAIDVNYNLARKQNHHFRLGSDDEGKHARRVLTFVQEVVRTGAAFATFDIFASRTDLLQWDAAAAFNRLLPPYLEALVARAQGTTPPTTTEPPATAGAVLPERARALAVTRADVKRARDATSDKGMKANLDLVHAEWDTLDAWLYGADVVEEGAVRGRLLGMIPMHRTFVSLMLDAGWSWGGNWKGSKDYMHFEDRGALARLQVTKAAAEDDRGESFVESFLDAVGVAR
jgi:hypothetical protein